MRLLSRTKLRISNASLIGLWVLLVEVAASGRQPPPACRAASDLLASGRLEEALPQYDKCLEEGPGFDDFLGMGEAYARLGRYEEAIMTYRQAIALRPGDPSAVVKLGAVLIKAGHYEDAVHQLAWAALVEPQNSRAHDLLALSLFHLKAYELAAVEAGKAHEANPADPSAAFILGSCYLHLGLYRRAVPLLRQVLSRTGSPQVHVTLGKAYVGIHEDALALAEFMRAEQENPRIPGLYSEMGAAYADLGDLDNAEKAYRKALESDPNDVAANYALVRTSLLRGDFEAAQRFLAKASQTAPDDPLIELEEAELAVHDRDDVKAETLLRKVVEELPDCLRAHVLLSQVYLRLHKVAEAKREQAVAKVLQDIEQARREEGIGAAGKKKPVSTPEHRSPNRSTAY